jgi:hypothetical protein
LLPYTVEENMSELAKSIIEREIEIIESNIILDKSHLETLERAVSDVNERVKVDEKKVKELETFLEQLK